MQLFITVSRMHMPKVASCPLLPSESLGNFAVIPYVYCFTNFFQFLVNFSVICVVYWNKVHILLKAQLTVVCYGTVILCSD